jgi:hypothetical protein
VSSPCRQPKTLVVYAAENSLPTTQQRRDETVEHESGRKAETVAKDTDETTAHTTTHPIPFPTPTYDADPTPLPPFCMTVSSSEFEFKPPPQFHPGSMEDRRGRVVGNKRKSKHVGGSKRKNCKRMMP